MKFHNGEPFNAEAVKFTMDRILDPNGKSVWKARFPSVDRAEVVDSQTVDIISKVPNAALVNVMATIWIQPPSYFQQVGEVKFNEAPIGTVGYVMPTSLRHSSGTVKNVGLSWSLNSTVYGSPDYAQIYVQAGARGFPITCTVIVDGKVTERRSTEGPYGQMVCQG